MQSKCCTTVLVSGISNIQIMSMQNKYRPFSSIKKLHFFKVLGAIFYRTKMHPKELFAELLLKADRSTRRDAFCITTVITHIQTEVCAKRKKIHLPFQNSSTVAKDDNPAQLSSHNAMYAIKARNFRKKGKSSKSHVLFALCDYFCRKNGVSTSKLGKLSIGNCVHAVGKGT